MRVICKQILYERGYPGLSHSKFRPQLVHKLYLHFSVKTVPTFTLESVVDFGIENELGTAYGVGVRDRPLFHR